MWFEEQPLEGGVVHYRVSNRLSRVTGFTSSFYLVDGLLVDTGFPHLRPLVVEGLAQARVQAICLTHHHEDHGGNAAALAVSHDCPIFLARPELRWTEGVATLRFYRQLWWGPAEPYEARPLPEVVASTTGRLVALSSPGHSASHTCFLHESTGTVFTGDLFLNRHIGAVMSHEDLNQIAQSLRKVAAMKPRLALSGHGHQLPEPASLFVEKADALEAAMEQVRRWRDQGLSEEEMVACLFRRGTLKDRFFERLTGGEFCRLNFVRACLHPVRQGANPSSPPASLTGEIVRSSRSVTSR
jgi:glyoxylase-like metal-dependent hydrolase (beta-lactamase superfamily II)